MEENHVPCPSRSFSGCVAPGGFWVAHFQQSTKMSKKDSIKSQELFGKFVGKLESYDYNDCELSAFK